MDTNTLNTVNAVLEKEAGYRLAVNPLADALHNKLATDDQVVQQNRASGANSTPSSNSSPGMEDKNDGYGKSDKKLDDDPSKDGAQETGEPQISTAGVNITNESSGIGKDLSIKQHGKEASLEFLRATSPDTNKSRLKAMLKG